jgi:hypothetical protein
MVFMKKPERDRMTSIAAHPALRPLLDKADHIDVKTIEIGAAPSPLALRTFIVGMLSYNPRWITLLYRIRGQFVRLLGMRQDGIPAAPALRPEALPMEPGAPISFFTVTAAQEGQYWVASASESHLTASLGVVMEAWGAGSRFQVITIVRYHRWTGPVYFNGIRPFHHLVVRRMMRAGGAMIDSAL